MVSLLLQVQQFKHKMTHQQVSDARTFVVLQQHTTAATDFVFFAVSLHRWGSNGIKDAKTEIYLAPIKDFYVLQPDRENLPVRVI